MRSPIFSTPLPKTLRGAARFLRFSPVFIVKISDCKRRTSQNGLINDLIVTDRCNRVPTVLHVLQVFVSCLRHFF